MIHIYSDNAILEFIENHTTLHQTVEFMAIAGHYEVSLVDDRGGTPVRYAEGATLREAVSKLMAEVL